MPRGEGLLRRVVVAVLLGALLVSCDFLSGVFSGYTRVAFSVEAAAGGRDFSSASQPAPNELIVLDSRGDWREQERIPLVAGKNVASVPRNGTYLFGLTTRAVVWATHGGRSMLRCGNEH